MTVAALAAMPPAVRAAYGAAFTASLNTVFLVAAVVSAVAFACTWLLPERPLRATLAASAGEVGNEVSEAFGRPVDEEGAEEQIHEASERLASHRAGPGES
jgi:hypothetical protein